MSRSNWKGSFLDKCILKNLEIENKKIWSRRSTIPSMLIGRTVLIYNGKKFKSLTITRQHVGYKLGDFAPTRLHTVKKSVKKK